MNQQYGNRVANARRRPSGEHTPQRAQGNTKKISNWKTPGLDGTHGFGLKNSPPYTTDLILKWINASRKLRYPNGWPKGRPP